VSYQITLPASAHLETETVNGSFTVRGVTGEMELDSVNGAVEATGAGGPMDAATVNGSLTVRYGPAPEQGSHEFDTVNGGIRTDFPREVKKARFGPMRSLDGTLGPGTSDTIFDLATVNGGIGIRNAGDTESSVR
jgi:DUF4097 and DUF4098 domain-containing protein YvlB